MNTSHINQTSSQLLAASLVVLMIAAAVSRYEDIIVKPIGIPSDGGEDESAFSEGRARKHLDSLAELGIRTLGSKSNEQKAPETILKAVSDAVAEARSKNKTTLEVETELQFCGRGQFMLHRHDINATSSISYQDVKNVIFRLSRSSLGKQDSNGSSDDFKTSNSNRAAVLVSSHFDSAISTVGAADDLYAVSVSLEIMQALLLEEDEMIIPNDVDLIFAINGGEESSLIGELYDISWDNSFNFICLASPINIVTAFLFININIVVGSHCFITQHRWSKDIMAFVNFESMGSAVKRAMCSSLVV